jgi:hypothetical protein
VSNASAKAMLDGDTTTFYPARAKGQRDSPDARARGDDIRHRLVRAVVHSGASCVAAVTGNSHARDHAANDRRIRRNFEARQFVNYG